MKTKIKLIVFFVVIGIICIVGYEHVTATEYITQGKIDGAVPEIWNDTIANSVNKKGIELFVDGTKIEVDRGRLYMDDNMTIMMPTDVMTEAFDCSVNLYDDMLLIERGATSVKMWLDKYEIQVNDEKMEIKSASVQNGKVVYVPINSITDNFGYTYNFDVNGNIATLINENPKERSVPYAYCYKDYDRLSVVKNQGYFGTCWAAAACTALETSLRPEEKMDFAIDHMSINNSYNISQYDGGDYLMAIAYLAAWQGPVLTVDDAYGDGVSDNKLPEVKHVQEVQILPSKDYETIKKMVYKYGGVSTSLYTSLTDSYGSSPYYNKDNKSYCYIGENKPNHEVVIVGWDDNFPKEKFNTELEGNGAFICQSSWGKSFGDNGLFYVSYYDVNIGIHNVVYTSIEDTDNYNDIYQSDLCGWRGNLGYERESAYFANVYRANTEETLSAVGFYTTDVDTYYEVAVCTNFDNVKDLNKKNKVLASGILNNSGYYTIKLNESVILTPGSKFAIVMYISTPNATRPIAVEIATDYKTSSVDVSDGEGYISYTGKKWESVEENYNCNLCLKGYVNR